MPVSGNKMTVEHVQLKRGNSASWTSKNPTLLRGEIGLEMDTKKFKVGDGTTAWNDLDYWVDITEVVEHLQLKHNTASNWSTTNPTLKNGEIGLEMDTKKFKVGDGTTAWNSLPYWCDTADPADVTIIDGGEITG